MDRRTAWQLTKSVTRVVFVLCLVLRRVDLAHIMILPRLSDRQTERLSHSFLSLPASCPSPAASTHWTEPQNGSTGHQTVPSQRGEGRGTGGGGGVTKQKSCHANSKKRKSPVCFTTVLQPSLGRVAAAACRKTRGRRIRPARHSLSSSLPSSLAAARLNHQWLSATRGCTQILHFLLSRHNGGRAAAVLTRRRQREEASTAIKQAKWRRFGQNAAQNIWNIFKWSSSKRRKLITSTKILNSVI